MKVLKLMSDNVLIHKTKNELICRKIEIASIEDIM